MAHNLCSSYSSSLLPDTHSCPCVPLARAVAPVSFSSHFGAPISGHFPPHQAALAREGSCCSKIITKGGLESIVFYSMKPHREISEMQKAAIAAFQAVVSGVSADSPAGREVRERACSVHAAESIADAVRKSPGEAALLVSFFIARPGPEDWPGAPLWISFKEIRRCSRAVAMRVLCVSLHLPCCCRCSRHQK